MLAIAGQTDGSNGLIFFEETHGYTILFKFHGQRWALPLVIHKRMHIIKPLSKKEKSFK